MSSLTCGAPVAGAAVAAGPHGIRLVIEQTPGFARVAALYYRPIQVPDTLRYEMEVVRESLSGRSVTKQGGSIAPDHTPSDTLSVARVNTATGDRLQVRLRLYAAGTLVDEVRRDTVVSAAD